MTITTTETDTLTLDLVKQHLLVDHTVDDVIIQHYIDSSIPATQNYTNKSVLSGTYTNTTDELVPVYEFDGYYTYKLRIPFCPTEVTITYPTGTITVFKDDIEYDNKDSLLYITTNEVPTTITADIESNLKDINQARLLTVGSWYANRESETITSTKVLPFGVTFILDSASGSVL